MTEEIYINGELMDLDADFKGVQMVFQSPYLTDLKSIVSNRTNSVTFPATERNKSIIGCTTLQQDSNFPYRKHRAIYKREGVQMFDGKATLLSVTDKQIQMCFTWGNTDAFQKLFETNLRELDLGYCAYPPTIGDANYLNYVKFGCGREGVGVSVESILTAIQTKCGVTGLTQLANASSLSSYKYVLALTSKNGDERARLAQGTEFGLFKSLRTEEYVSSFCATNILKGLASRDPHKWCDSDGVINCSSAKTIRLLMSGSIEITQPMTASGVYNMYLVGNYQDSWYNAHTILLANGINQGVDSGGNRKYKYEVNIDQLINVETDQFLMISVSSDIAAYPATVRSDNLSIYVVLDPDEKDEIIYGFEASMPLYPIGLNLPDITCGDFIKNLLWLKGLFAFSDDGKTIQFVSFNQLESNKSVAIDWTDKMITTQPKQRETKLDGTAQKNYFRYAEADWYDNTEYQGVLTTDDETIEDEKEYCKSAFALAPSNLIPIWALNEDNEIDFVGDNMPTVLLVGGWGAVVRNAAYMSIQIWEHIFTMYYQQYAAMIQHPVVIKADFLITTTDLNALDMRIPVYLKQTGRYYAIRKLTTKNAKVAEAELIELK